MKYVFYLLVLANLAFFLWEIAPGRSHEAQESVQTIAIPSGGERIVLLKEAPVNTLLPSGGEDVRGGLSDAPAASPSGDNARGKARKGKANCFMIGPNLTQADADTVLELLSSHARDATVVTRPGDVPDGWWIIYPRAINGVIARQNRAMLAAKGVHDTWIFENGPLQWGISLGLYDTLDQAEEAQKQFEEKNLMTDVTPRMVRGSVYWVKVPWRRPSLELDEIVQVLNSQDPSLRIPSPVPCD